MFNPFDGATFLTGTVFLSIFGIITGNSPLIAGVAAAAVTGIFVVLAKVIELYVRHRTDKTAEAQTKRIAELEAQLNGKQKDSLT